MSGVELLINDVPYKFDAEDIRLLRLIDEYAGADDQVYLGEKDRIQYKAVRVRLQRFQHLGLLTVKEAQRPSVQVNEQFRKVVHRINNPPPGPTRGEVIEHWWQRSTVKLVAKCFAWTLGIGAGIAAIYAAFLKFAFRTFA